MSLNAWARLGIKAGIQEVPRPSKYPWKCCFTPKSQNFYHLLEGYLEARVNHGKPKKIQTYSLGKCSVFHVSIALNASPLTQVPWCHIGGCKLKMRRFEAPKKVNEYIILCTLIYIYIYIMYMLSTKIAAVTRTAYKLAWCQTNYCN